MNHSFRVTLDEINEKSSKGMPRTDYVFAISEESPDSPAQPPAKPEMAAEKPYFYARLAIEPADKDSARLRLEIENGKIPIETFGTLRRRSDSLISSALQASLA